jgi:hypothetical protein
MSSRAFLNSFMLCPRLRAKSGNFFAPKRTRTMRRIINRSVPPRFPIPNASMFITILDWSGLMFYSSRSAYIVFNMHRIASLRSGARAPSRTRFASPLVKLSLLAAGCTPDEEAQLAVDAITEFNLLSGKSRVSKRVRVCSSFMANGYPTYKTYRLSLKFIPQSRV